MTFDHSPQMEDYARSARDAFDAAEDGPEKHEAGVHLRRADVAERYGDEVAWILAIERAARALERRAGRNGTKAMHLAKTA